MPSIISGGSRGFPQLRTELIAGKGRGIVANMLIPRHSCIPILGSDIVPRNNLQSNIDEDTWNVNDIEHKLTEMNDPRIRYLIEISTKMVVCCWPTCGLHIAGLLNEPAQGEKPNCAISGGFFVTIRVIQPGEELLWVYGTNYVRDYSTSRARGKHLDFRLPISRMTYKTMYNIPHVPYNGHDGITRFLDNK